MTATVNLFRGILTLYVKVLLLWGCVTYSILSFFHITAPAVQPLSSSRQAAKHPVTCIHPPTPYPFTHYCSYNTFLHFVSILVSICTSLSSDCFGYLMLIYCSPILISHYLLVPWCTAFCSLIRLSPTLQLWHTNTCDNETWHLVLLMIASVTARPKASSFGLPSEAWPPNGGEHPAALVMLMRSRRPLMTPVSLPLRGSPVWAEGPVAAEGPVRSVWPLRLPQPEAAWTLIRGPLFPVGF